MADSAQRPYTQAGHLVAGKYRVERVLGVGGMGVVVKANHEMLDEPVAIKFLLPDFAQKPEWVARFVREAKAARRIKGEHVTHIHDVGQLEDGSPYIVMEFLDGSDVDELVRAKRQLANDEAADIIIHACAALSDAHAGGIVHRDLKPANLFRTRTSGGRVIVKVLDFGISKLATDDAKGLTNTSTVMGSALYMSPEQLQSSRDVDSRTDLYALGVTLYQLLSGGFPFNGDTMPQLVGAILTKAPTPLSQLRPDLPAELLQVVHRAFAHKREDRYQTAAELAAALAPFASAESKALARRLAPSAVAPSAAPPAATPQVGQVSETEFMRIPQPAEKRALAPSDPGMQAVAPQPPAAAPSAPAWAAPTPSQPGFPAASPSAPHMPAQHPSSPGMPAAPPMSAHTAATMSREMMGTSKSGSNVPLLAAIGTAAALCSIFLFWFFGAGGESTAETIPTTEESSVAASEDAPDVSPAEPVDEPEEPEPPEETAPEASSAGAASAVASASAAGSAEPESTSAPQVVAPKPPIRRPVTKKPNPYGSRE